MANNIEKFKKYIDLLDEVYVNGSLTSVLDGSSKLVKVGSNADELLVPIYDLVGLGDYSRTEGNAPGAIDLQFESVKFNFDRGRDFSVDAQDNEETAGIAFGELSSVFLNKKVIPELDAFRFATYAAGTAAGNVLEQTFADGEEALEALINAMSKLDEDEVPAEGRILFITPSVYNKIMGVNTSVSKEILDGFEKIVKVTPRRFYTAIDTLSGRGTENEGGFVKAADAKDINFMIIQKDGVMQYPKNVITNVFAPSENQTMFAWKFMYRNYGLSQVRPDRHNYIYYSHKNA